MLFFNIDCTDFFYRRDHAGTDGGRQVDQYVDRILEGGVTHLLCNTQGRRANYDSAVWEPFWMGYDPDGPDSQPFLAPLVQEGADSHANWQRLVRKMLSLKEQGVDYPARVLARTREAGVAAWISLRMNDVHCQDNEAHPIHCELWRHNPRLRRQGDTGYFAKAFDYAHAEVRDHYLALIEETLERYDIDGLELDFMREPYLSSRGEEQSGREVLTAWLRGVRARLQAEAAKRGHAIQLGVRVPSRPEVAERFGLDPVTWAREGLIDLLVPTPRWASIEFDIPISAWRDLLADTSVLVAGGLEINCRPHRGAGQHRVTPAQARGAAAQVLADGADGIYLFNYFPPEQTGGQDRWWTAEEYPEVLRSLASLQCLERLPRSHIVINPDLSGPDTALGQGDGGQLPAEGARLELTLPTGPEPDDGWTATLSLVAGIRGSDVAEPPVVRVNSGPQLALRDSRTADGEQDDDPMPRGYSRFTCDLPVGCLRNGEPNRIELEATGRPVIVLGLAIDVAPPEPTHSSET